MPPALSAGWAREVLSVAFLPGLSSSSGEMTPSAHLSAPREWSLHLCDVAEGKGERQAGWSPPEIWFYNIVTLDRSTPEERMYFQYRWSWETNKMLYFRVWKVPNSWRVLLGLYGKTFQICPNPLLSIHVLFSLPRMCLFYGQAPPSFVSWWFHLPSWHQSPRMNCLPSSPLDWIPCWAHT